MAEYILLPRRGVRVESKEPNAIFFANLHHKLLTPTGQAASVSTGMGWRAEQPELVHLIEDLVPEIPSDTVPMTLLDSVHEDGAKLVELSDDAALRIRSRSPFVR